MKDIFVIYIEETICGCGMEMPQATMAFTERKNAEDYCKQFNEIHKPTTEQEDAVDFNKLKAYIHKVTLFENETVRIKPIVTNN